MALVPSVIVHSEIALWTAPCLILLRHATGAPRPHNSLQARADDNVTTPSADSFTAVLIILAGAVGAALTM